MSIFFHSSVIFFFFFLPLTLKTFLPQPVSPSPPSSPLLPPRTSHYPPEERRPTCSPPRPRTPPTAVARSYVQPQRSPSVHTLTRSFILLVDFFHSLLIFASIISIAQLHKIVIAYLSKFQSPTFKSKSHNPHKSATGFNILKYQGLGS